MSRHRPGGLIVTDVIGGGASDTTAPTVAITSTSTSPTLTNPVAITITFSEAVTGFVVGDITISAGGSLASFTTADNIVFTVSWTLAVGANTMDINAGVCTDAAGNNNTAATQFAMTLSPLAIAGLVRWIDFSTITGLYQTNDTSTPVTADAQTIGYATDKSGAGRHYTQGTAANRPVWKANIQNGLGVCRFVDTSDILTCTADTYADITFFYIWKSGDGNNHYWLSFGDTNHALIQNFTAGKLEWYSSPRTVIGDQSTTDFKNIYSIVGSATNTNPWSINGSSTLGTGDAGELLVYSSELSAGNQTLVAAYLTLKWNVGF